MFQVYAIYTRHLSAQAQYSRSCQNICSLRYNSSLDTWTVVRLTAAKFKHLRTVQKREYRTLTTTGDTRWHYRMWVRKPLASPRHGNRLQWWEKAVTIMTACGYKPGCYRCRTFLHILLCTTQLRRPSSHSWEACQETFLQTVHSVYDSRNRNQIHRSTGPPFRQFTTALTRICICILPSATWIQNSSSNFHFFTVNIVLTSTPKSPK
jgi:hypothetical protein